MSCDRFRAAIVEAWGPGVPLPAHASAHLEQCETCRSWAAAFADGAALAGREGESLTAVVLARTSGAACGRARELMASRVDVPIDDIDRALVAGHLEHCPACAGLGSALEAALEELPGLALLDPGPGFAERVIAQTSRRPARPTVAERWRRIWETLVKRPRFTWEAAYVATLCWLIFFGPSVKAFEWTASATTAAREQVPNRLDAIGQVLGRWRAEVGTELGSVRATVAERQESWVDSAAAAFTDAVEWARKTAAAFLERLAPALQATADWFKEFFASLVGGPTEPRAGPARSPE